MTAIDVIPVAGERVIEVAQADSHLLSLFDAASVLGQPEDAINRHIGTRWGAPRWKTYDPQHDPAWGCGLIVVREGRLRRGPTRWDSS